MNRVLLDASILIGAGDLGDLEGAISAASLAKLHFGTLVAGDPDERARRAQRLVDAAVAREWGRLSAAVAQRGGTADTADLAIIDDHHRASTQLKGALWNDHCSTGPTSGPGTWPGRLFELIVRRRRSRLSSRSPRV